MNHELSLRAQTCKHFNGTVHARCKVGVAYQGVTDYPSARAQNAPFFQTARACFSYDDAECGKICAQREFYTPDELATQTAQREAKLKTATIK